MIRNKIYNDSGNSIWKAVKSAKNQSPNDIPNNLSVGGADVDPLRVADAFAAYFHDKVETLKSNTIVNPDVYNGKNKLIVTNRPFMTESDVRECLATLKPKKCEGFDRLPVKMLSDARDPLLPTLTVLFMKIYEQKCIPDQWKISKITPIHKKGNRCINLFFSQIFLHQFIESGFGTRDHEIYRIILLSRKKKIR